MNSERENEIPPTDSAGARRRDRTLARNFERETLTRSPRRPPDSDRRNVRPEGLNPSSASPRGPSQVRESSPGAPPQRRVAQRRAPAR